MGLVAHAQGHGGSLDLVVPAYVHPLDDPAAWQRLATWAPMLRGVIVNVHDGPGAELDPAYPPAVAALRTAGVRLLGYVDTDYGARPAAAVIADLDTWMARYRVDGIFLDQVSVGLDRLDHYCDLALACRSRGADFVALNPGAVPHPGYLDLANVTITFEGSYHDYLQLREPGWLARGPSRGVGHLVHGAPDAAGIERTVRLAATRAVGSLGVTTGQGANPWALVEPALARAVAALNDATTPAAG